MFSYTDVPLAPSIVSTSTLPLMRLPWKAAQHALTVLYSSTFCFPSSLSLLFSSQMHPFKYLTCVICHAVRSEVDVGGTDSLAGCSAGERAGTRRAIVPMNTRRRAKCSRHWYRYKQKWGMMNIHSVQMGVVPLIDVLPIALRGARRPRTIGEEFGKSAVRQLRSRCAR